MKPKQTLIALLSIVLCMCLCACDLGAMLGDFGSFLGMEDDTDKESLPAGTIPVITSAPTEATETTAPPTEPPTEPTPDLYWVCAIGDLKVRSGPGRDYESIGKVDDGSIVEPLRWVNGWAYLQYPVAGWCSGDYLHPLGWYNDVKLPSGVVPEDRSLTGKWVHATQPIRTGSDRYTRAGILELKADGTFTHSIADVISYTAGRWKVRNLGASGIIWEGEYQFDGSTLVLNYMVYQNVSYDSDGEPSSREWYTATYTLTLDVTKANDTMRFTIPSGDVIPCYAGFTPDDLTLNVLRRAANTQAFPEDIYNVLASWFN